MKRVRLTQIAQVFGMGVLATIAGCSGTSSSPSSATPPPPVITIAISPTSGSVQTGLTLQFAATVTGSANTAVTWQVNSVTGGYAATGTISTSGLYTAPASVPSPNTVTVTAISLADSTKSVSATVTILPPPVSVAVTPTTAGVITLHTQQFAATVSNTSNTTVAWGVNGIVGGSATVGTISTSGLYTAPQNVPSPAVVTVTATSAADTTKSASAQITVQAPTVPTGTWSSIGPSGITDSVTLVPDPNSSQTMYAAPIHGGLYKTTNLGQSWSLLPTASTSFPLSPVIAPASGTLYALSQNTYQVSTDGGKTFSATVKYPGNLDSELNGGFTFAVDPKNDQTVYVLTPSSLQKSTNGGATWTNLTAPTTPYLVNTLAFPAIQTLTVSRASSSTLLCASTAGFEISTDGGTTWKFQNTGLDPSFLLLRQVIQDPANPNRLLAFGTYSLTTGTSPLSYIYLSTDGGGTWAHVGTFSVSGQLAPTQTGPGIYVLSSPGLFASFNGGTTWTNIAPSADASGYTAVVSAVSPLVIAYEGFNDLSISQDGGATWTVSETGLNAHLIGHVAYAGTTGPLYAALPYANFIVSGSYSTQLWHASDATQPWTRTVGPYSATPVMLFDADPQNPLHLLGVEQGGGSSVSAFSTDSGSTWTTTPYASGMTNGFLPYRYSAVHFGAPGSNVAYACGTFGIARLSTVSNTWTIINNGITSSVSCSAMGVNQLTSGTLYADTASGVYGSTDGGNNWTLLFADTGSYVSVIVDPTNSQNVYLAASVGASNQSMRSTNAGKNWVPMLVEGQMAINPTTPTILYAITQGGILAASYDSGLTWATTTSPYNFLQDIVVTSAGVVVISTFGSSVIAFAPH